MTASQNYRFHRAPRLSTNHVADYLSATNATQRARVICAAKFPKTVEVAAYGQVRPHLSKALCKTGFDHPVLEALADRMATKARRESGYHQDEALRCEKAIRAFMATFNPTGFKKCTFSAAPAALSMILEGVTISVWIDAAVTSTADGVTNSGGIILLYGFAADRGSFKEKLTTAASLILWSLEGAQMEPLARLCIAADIARAEIVKASNSTSRFRTKLTDTCGEIATCWDRVEPPPDYDGPNWR